MDLRRSLIQRLLYCIALLLSLSACSNTLQAPDQSDPSQHPEAAYCGSAQKITYAAPVTTVSGNAKFYYRNLDWTSSMCQGLCNNPVSTNIPLAEVHILDAANNIIQCGETDANGNFTNMQIPRSDGSYKVRVLSRSNTSSVRASVLEDIYSATPYSIEAAFAISGGQSTVTGVNLAASARASDSNSKIPGGAFNILANIYWANQFLRAQSGNPTFVADKVTIFWKAGFNPYSYYGSPNALASFYVSNEDRLYILGGKNGDVKNSDTDHFDDSVILHEYGHFLESHYGHSDSQGGSHNGNFIIDPRLAWSEGWANYFQAAVLDTIVYSSSSGIKGSGGYTNYIDTVGFKSDSVEGTGSSAGISIRVSMTEAAATAVYDKPAANEGVFREFSISRTLFKTLKAAIPFSAVWQAFTSLNDVVGTYTPPHKFINFGLFNYKLNTRITDSTQNTNWRAILTEENQKRDTTLYGNTLNAQAPSPSCPTVNMNPVVDAVYGYDRSNQLMSNDFYTYYHDGQSKTLSLIYSTGSGGADIVDLNLYLYANGYYYSEEVQEAQAGFSNSTLLKKSKTINVSSNAQSESVDLTGLPAGYYMINVKSSTYGKTASSFDTATATYYLYSGSLCLVPN
ncbi:MAG: hypothetical protein IPM97_04295 [Bdellovibrionaceae bacterium]|nr:hypothetical protein [Pseudobdellovibrionaceae bacterium]